MNKAGIRILLIEDDEDDYILTRDLLHEIRGSAISLQWVSDYEVALQLALSNEHDIVLIDYRLGERTGLDLLRDATAKGCNAPFIILTGQGDREVDMEAMKAGAADYLVKGKFDASTLERVIRYAMERAITLRELRAANEKLEEAMQAVQEEMAMAEMIQRSMLPDDLRRFKGVSIAARYLPCGTIGGDLYDVIGLGPDRIAFLMADVVGHGVPAALVTAMAKIVFSRNILDGHDPRTTLINVNGEITRFKGEPSLTAVLGILDLEQRTFTFARAGHPPPLLVRTRRQETEILGAEGITIGFISQPEYDQRTISMEPGDKLVFYTDGLTESPNQEKERFRLWRLQQLLVSHAEKDSEETASIIERAHIRFRGNAQQLDDIAFMIVELLE